MSKQLLNRLWLASNLNLNSNVSVGSLAKVPEKIIQFGEGNFLRTFVGWMVDGMNAQGVFNGSIVVVQPINRGLVEFLNHQDGCYTVLTRGMNDGHAVVDYRVVTSISRGVNPYTHFDIYRQCAGNSDLRFVVSNTTEAGITYLPELQQSETVQASFPAKICAFLYERFQTFNGARDKGLVILPCELINFNGEKLVEYVLKHAADWALEDEFVAWVKSANTFCNTLVDRIVPGYPADEIDEICDFLGYDDKLLSVGEHYHLWVIEGPEWLKEELPLAKSGYNVIVTDDMQPYRTRKVRVLNGVHTACVLAAYHYGHDTVGEMMDNSATSTFVHKAAFDEILPGFEMDEEEKKSFAEAVIERFKNPFVRHQLLDISLNSSSKWKVRVLPSLKDYVAGTGKLPDALTFSLAAMLNFYRGELNKDGLMTGSRAGESYQIRDDAQVLVKFADRCQLSDDEYAHSVLADSELWGEDLTLIKGLSDKVTAYLKDIRINGMQATLNALTKQNKDIE